MAATFDNNAFNGEWATARSRAAEESDQGSRMV